MVNKKKTLRYLSLGAGVQSTALLVMANDGLIGDIEFALFADTGDEPKYVHEYIEILKSWSKIPIHTCQTSKEGLSHDIINKFNHNKIPKIPVYFNNNTDGKKTIAQRQCTYDYKIKPLERFVKEYLGIKKGMKAKGVLKVDCIIGISTDEIQRMKDSLNGWTTNIYPLIEKGINTNSCLDIVEKAGLPKPSKSACFHCPYHSHEYWVFLKKNHCSEFDRAVEFEKKMWKAYQRDFYLTKYLKPIGEIDFSEYVGLFDNDVDGFNNECDGICGV